MKELSIEEKAKAYDEAIERAKEIHNEHKAQPFDVMLKVFPELAESDDERIRKALIRAFKSLNTIKIWNVIERTDILAWLEKQSTLAKLSEDEQKPDDKIEPKFKVGDWTVSNLDKKARQISEFHFDEYNSYYVVDGKSVNLEEYDRLHHLWTISDAKPGDVIYLPNGNNEYYFFIFKGIENAAVNSFAHFHQYNDGTSEVEGTIDRLFSVNDVFHPATKEQRELLFQKMKEAGYEWDEDKKELKKIEQNPWSEEDEFNLSAVIAKIQYDIDNGRIGQNRELLSWVKSIKDRVQPKQEWSKEDIRNIEDIDSVLFYDKELPEDTCMRLRNWLKSLRPQNTWKLSGEQIEALESATENCAYSEYQDCLRELIGQVKKLRG